MATDTAERRLHPWSWLFVLLQQLRQFLLPLLVLVFVGGRGEDSRYMLWALVGAAALVASAAWRYFTYRYRIDDDRLVVREGALERNVRQVPFARIHNVALHQTLLHRAFGVAEVRLESAGGTRPEAEMRVLPIAEALALERTIRTRGHPGAATANGGPADAMAPAPADAAGRVLLALPVPELVRLGLASNRGMVVVAGAFALAWQVLPDRLMADLMRDWTGQAVGYAGTLVHGTLSRVLAAAGLVVVALALLRLLSVLLALIQYHGFRLVLDGRRLTVERGLLSRLRTSVSRRRIQAWTLRESVLHRLLGRRALHVDTVGGAGEDGEQRALRELAPIATPGACDALVREVLPGAGWPTGDWRPLHPRAWLRIALPGLALAAIATLAACWFAGPAGLLALALGAWALFAARRHAARAGYAHDGRLLAVRGGWWSRYWRFAEVEKLQALRFTRSPLDRLFGMATLSLDTAGARTATRALQVRHLPEAEARTLHEHLVAAVARLPLRW